MNVSRSHGAHGIALDAGASEDVDSTVRSDSLTAVCGSLEYATAYKIDFVVRYMGCKDPVIPESRPLQTGRKPLVVIAMQHSGPLCDRSYCDLPIVISRAKSTLFVPLVVHDAAPIRGVCSILLSWWMNPLWSCQVLK